MGRTLKSSNIKKLRDALLGWFDANKRDLPWRGKVSPYGVLVSELMLQQTTVAAVIPFYKKWMNRFPSIAALARADADDVLRHWAGLGYYSRARNLHRAAQVIREEHRGRVPRDPAVLRALPGIGEYTAAAVASIAYGAPTPAVDANAIRVYSRLGAIPGNAAKAATKKQIAAFAESLLDPQHAGDFNQAIMELGALVCTPAEPGCAGCPVSGFCAALGEKRVAHYPHKAAGPRTVRLETAAALVVRHGAVLLRRRPHSGPMAGLWEPPCAEMARGESPEAAAVRAAREQAGAAVDSVRQRDKVSHAFTHHRITIRVVECRVRTGAQIAGEFKNRARWVPLAETGGLALTGAAMKIFKTIP